MDRRPLVPAGLNSVRLNIQGHLLEITCAPPGLRQVMADVLSPLRVIDLPPGCDPIEGRVDAYDGDAVARSLSPRAERIATIEEAEVWRDGERCWLLDDAWGLCEINLLRRSFRSWVLPNTPISAMRTLDHAVLWPIAQLLSTRGLSLVPAASVVHRGRGVLVLSPFSLEPELTAILDAGHGLVGQRWTAVRDDEGRPLMLSLPGRVERAPVPQLRSRVPASMLLAPRGDDWIDLSTIAQSPCNASWCDAIFVIEPGRRALPRMTALTGASAAAAIRRAWPMPDLGVAPRHAQFVARLTQQARVYQIELSRDPRAMLRLLDELPTDVAFQRHKLVPQVHVAPRRLAV